jgi:serine/threonine protein kinase
MDKRYQAYCLTDPAYYDQATAGNGRGKVFAALNRKAPQGWSARASADWWHLAPDDHRLPDQGWKIHVSATMEGAERVVDAVWDYCVGEHVAFKFVQGPTLLYLRNSKYADRGSSGKLATVYPQDEAEFEHLLAGLDRKLHGERGPYILSDLRYGDGPLHVRYGGFAPRRCLDDTGRLVPAISDPQGRLIPDVRGPVFAPPPWVSLPEFLSPHLAARNTIATTDLPYKITKALHFSNGGGVYLADDLGAGGQVVLKEARPHAGLVGTGEDAVARLQHERAMLEKAAGSGIAPEVRGSFMLGEHHFLVLEHIEGGALNSLFTERYPLSRPQPDPEALAAYTAWALRIQRSAEQAVAALHERGVVFNDLHLFNIVVRPDETVALIDFEVAAPADADARRTLASRAFQAPADRTGVAVDRYALACLRIALFLPLTALLALDRSRAAAMADAIASEFPDVPRRFLDEAVREIGAETPPLDTPFADAAWPALREALSDGIHAAATPEREDRLFPGDIRQFTVQGGGINLAHGAAGVLYALHTSGVAIEPEFEGWFLRRSADPVPEMPLGFFDGIHGVSHVLDLLGHREPALRLVAMALDEQWQRLGTDLYGGLAGIGLNLLHFARRTGDAALHEHARAAARLAADRLDATEPTPRAGLMRGWSGPALLFLELFEETGDKAWLEYADAALRLDLRRCVPASNGSGALHVNEGWRTMPYLADGSVGIGMVLRRLQQHRPAAEDLDRTADAIRVAATSRFYVQSGLFAGRAGMILALADESGRRTPTAETLEQIRRLSWHAVRRDGRLMFPGEQLLRLSTDLATGSAGILLALGAALHDGPAHLPFLGPCAPKTAPPARG